MITAQDCQEFTADTDNPDSNRYQRLFDQSPVASLLVNKDGLILRFNHRASDILLIDPELRSKPDLFGYVRQEDQTALTSHLLAAFLDPNQRSLNIRMLTVNGQEFLIRMISMPVEDDPDILLVTLLELGQQPRNIKLLSNLAYYDQLTGLPNRLLFSDRLRWAIRDARRQKEHLAIMVVDLDNFKQVNDTLGHDAGDHFLKLISGRMASCLRDSDTLSRMGGDEFTILMQHFEDSDDVSLVACRLLESISHPVQYNGQEFTTTASIGVCLYPDDGDTDETVFQNADIAMYRSKTSGRNRVSFFNESMRVAATQQSKVEQNLRQAMQGNELEVYYQPLVDTLTSRIIGMEALLRWRTDVDNLLSAGQFLPLAENLGLGSSFSDWVMLQACRQMKDWMNRGVLRDLTDIRMAVNVSTRELGQADFPDKIRAALLMSELPASALAVETSEKSLQEDDPIVFENLRQLWAMGVELHLDDFTQGFGTLQKINSIHFSCLKINQIFTSVFLENPQGEALLAALVNLAHILGIKVIAEGIENQKAYALLKAYACDGMQGYYFSRPIPAIEMEMLLDIPQSS